MEWSVTERKPIDLFSQERPLSGGDLRGEKEPAIGWSGGGPFQAERATNAKTLMWEDTWHSQGQKEGQGGWGTDGKPAGGGAGNFRASVSSESQAGLVPAGLRTEVTDQGTGRGLGWGVRWGTGCAHFGQNFEGTWGPPEEMSSTECQAQARARR